MYNQQLPVPTNQVLQNQMVRSLPGIPVNQHPFSLLEPGTANLLHAELINGIQGGVNQSDYHIFFFNMISNNGFNNNEYVLLFEAAAKRLIFLCNNGQPVQNAIPQAAADTIVSEIVLIGNAFNLRSIIPHQARIFDEMVQYRSSLLAQMGIQQPIQQQGYGYQQAAPVVVAQNGYRQGGFNNQQSYGYQAPMQQNRPAIGASAIMTTHTQQQPTYAGNRPEVGVGAIQNISSNQNTVLKVDPYFEVDKAKTFTNSNDNMLKKPSGVTSMLTPQAMAGAVEKHLLFEELDFSLFKPVESPGKVIVVRTNDCKQKEYALVNKSDINKKDNNVQYETHETNADALRRNRPITLPVGDLIGRVKTPTVIPLNRKADAEVIVVDDKDPVILEGVIAASSLSQAIAKAQSEAFNKLDITPSEDRLFEYNVDIRHHFFVAKEDHDAIAALGRKKSLKTLAEALSSLKDTLEESVYWAIEDRLTKVVNETLQSSLNSTLTIDSIVEDYEDIAPYLVKKGYSESAITKFIEQVTLNCIYSLREDAKSSESFDGELVLLTRLSMTHLPIGVTELNLVLENEEFRLLKEEEHPELYVVLEDIVDRTTINTPQMKMPRVAHRIVKTIDNFFFEVTINAFGGLMIRRYIVKPF